MWGKLKKKWCHNFFSGRFVYDTVWKEHKMHFNPFVTSGTYVSHLQRVSSSRLGYCYPSGLEETLCKWDTRVPLVTKGLMYLPCINQVYNILITIKMHFSVHYVLFAIFSPTCFGRCWCHLQCDITTTIQGTNVASCVAITP